MAANSQSSMEARRKPSTTFVTVITKRHTFGYQLVSSPQAAGNQSAIHDGEDGIAELKPDAHQDQPAP
ncbi:hypothetical protein ACQP0C_27915 [Nocardia sp. CA-129566]|uniref:hypothetical protein n=1 Tax=Nocardia sp. CA-129566 TaxID=3239976 RepID=UPI003D99CB68